MVVIVVGGIGAVVFGLVVFGAVVFGAVVFGAVVFGLVVIAPDIYNVNYLIIFSFGT